MIVLFEVVAILGKTLRKLRVLDVPRCFHGETKLWTILTCEFWVDKLPLMWVRACELGRQSSDVRRFAAPDRYPLDARVWHGARGSAAQVAELRRIRGDLPIGAISDPDVAFRSRARARQDAPCACMPVCPGAVSLSRAAAAPWSDWVP